MKRFYITTAIDYPNGNPHMGHAYEKIVSDSYARWYRSAGYETRFLTGTDENGQKLVKSAEAAKKPTQKFVDENVDHFRGLCKQLAISHDDFIRTTEKRHHEVAQEIWKKIAEKGDIFEGEYEGLYCLACEAFYTETQTPDGKCLNHGTTLEKVKEKGYFFKLSKYAKWVEEYIEKNPGFVTPEKSRKEILQRLRGEPVRDLSVSRPNTGWGIPVPGDEKFVIYTWFDALVNYLAAVRTKDLYEKFWPADCHVIGKDITWFHAVIWPAMLQAAGFPIHKQVYVHGMVLGQDGRKMSKSLGNGVDPQTVLQSFPLDSFRYYILRAIPSGDDGAFVTADLQARHNSELANDLGNLLSRVVKLAIKKLPADLDLSQIKSEFDLKAVKDQMHSFMEKRDHSGALDSLWKLIHELNLYVTRKEPWKLTEQNDLLQVLGNAVLGIHAVAILLEPFMPSISPKMMASVGPQSTLRGSTKFDEIGEIRGFKLSEPEMLFPKLQ